jgi:hypothetical protein
MKRILIIAVMALLFAAPARAQSRCPGGAVNVSPGANLQALINANAGGTTYCLADGVYALSSITPKDNDRFYAATLHGAVLDGSYTAQHAFISTFDRNSEANVTGVWLDGLVVRRYRTANAWNNAAIDANRGWRLLNLLVEDNTSGVIFAKPNWMCSDGALVQNSTIRNNTHVALYWNGVDADFIGNTFVNNGWGAPQDDIQWYGSIKVTNQGVYGQSSICPSQSGAQVYATYNTSVYNAAAGWWQDINVRDFVFELNRVLFNDRWGFFQEIGGGGIVRNNTFECNRSRWSQGGSWGGAEVNVISSSGVIVESNTIRICAAGRSATINGSAYDTARAGRGVILLSEGRAPLMNNTIRNNVFVQMGAGIDWFSSIEQYSGSQSGNTFSGNIYYVSSAGQTRWLWFGAFKNFSTWQGTHAQDSGGSETTASPPTGAAPTPTTTPTQAIGSGTPTQTPAPTSTATLTPTSAPTSGAYSGAAALIPGRIQAENFDWGGAAYSDTTLGMDGGQVYRVSDVDLKASPYGGFTVGWFIDGEYLNYTVNVQTTGYYNLVLFGGTIYDSRRLRVEIGGVNRTGSVAMPNTGDWDVYTTVMVANIYLTSGTQTLRLVNEVGYLDVDWLEFSLISGVTYTPTATLTPSVTPTPSNTPVPGATATPSTTPTPLASYTPTPTLLINSALATLQADYYGLQTQVANAAATQSLLEATSVGAQEQIAEGRADLLDLTARLNAAWRAIRGFYFGP